ncbi:MAG: S41 family peptidase [Bacteroidales bacterium]|nr:S41 family peptidase [Bacteroidales bacterium]
MINNNYVETPDMNRLSEVAINAMLKDLDPHSMYIPAKDVQRTNESLVGNFDGIGITFQLVDDTICVGDVIVGGPSEKVGLQRGDKILRVNDTAATGDSISNSWVMKHLRGKKGTTVVLDILRDGETIKFHIVRDKIPIYSVDTYFMADDTTGYIRLARFARNSVVEFRKACEELKQKGMRAMIFDLRGNTGGYLDIACGIANEFLQKGSLLVYTDGRTVRRQNYVANSNGSFREGRLIVLIDENSASASEIVSGAIQDWDRGTIIGRRSFGKGLVQRVFPLKDGGQVRLTTARYYTPSGRCIQKPYEEGTDAYRKDLTQRYLSGELVSADSIHMPDSLKFTTNGGRTVYGGGGIVPDVFVAIDTMKLTPFFINLRSKGLLNKFPLHWADQHRNSDAVKDYESFLKNYDSFNIDTLFAHYAEEKEVLRDYEAEAALPKERVKHSDEYLHYVLKASIARNLFGVENYYMVMREIDEPYLRAMKELEKK